MWGRTSPPPLSGLWLQAGRIAARLGHRATRQVRGDGSMPPFFKIPIPLLTFFGRLSPKPFAGPGKAAATGN